MFRSAPLLATLLCLGSALPAWAQGFDFASSKSGNPLEIYADQGLELSQDARTVIARVNASATRGHVTLKGDVLIAHYREKTETPPDSASLTNAKTPAKPKAAPVPAADGSTKTDTAGGSEVWRVESQDHVTISTPTQTAYGDRADYNIDDAVVVLTGKDLRLVTPKDVVTARDSLEYWESRQQAVARGDAVAVHLEKRIQADTLVADFAEDKDKKMAINRVHGYDHVILTAPREVVTGDRADYNVESGIVAVTGSVKITRDDNQLDGRYALVNLNTGVSKIFPIAPGDDAAPDQRVKGLFNPHKDATAGGAAPPAPAALGPSAAPATAAPADPAKRSKAP
jgi:lipopolysaccharide export system protein LptA